MDLRRAVVLLGILSAVLFATSANCITLLAVRPNTDTSGSAPGTTAPASALVSVEDFRIAAEAAVDNSDGRWYYLNDAATSRMTLGENMAAFARHRLLPFNLRDVSQANTSATVLGRPVSMPIGISPVAQQTWLHPDGENATARAAGARNTVAAFSIDSSVVIEDIAKAAPGGNLWQQINLFPDRQLVLQTLKRIRDNGYSAVVLTIDLPVGGIRYFRRRGLLMNPNRPHPNFPDKSWQDLSYAAATWDDLCWLRRQTSMKLVVKGILRAEDAVRAVSCGADAVWVSNHGGRSLDRLPASIDVLPAVVAAVSGRAEVYLDSGVRNGEDVAIALALGADAVFVGRPAMYGLIHSGQGGVEAILDILHAEFLNAMKLLGASTPRALNASMVLRPDS